MAHREAKEKKSGRSAGIVIVLLIFLLLIGLAGYTYYSIVKAPLELDDPQAMAASTPMSVGERFRFSSADATAQVKLDKGDIWSLILAHAGDDFLDIINEELSSYSLSISGCGIHLDEEMLRLDLEVFYKENRLVIKVPCDLEINGGHIVLKPAGVKLGIISVPVEKLLDKVNLEYDIDLPVIYDVTLEGFVKDGILLNGSVDQDIRDLVVIDETFHRVTLFSESMQNIVNLMKTKEEWKNILSRFEKDPGSAEEFYEGIFILSDDIKRKNYLDGRYEITQRFFPGIDFADIKEDRNALISELGTDISLLKEFFTNVFDDYNDKKFKLADGEFLLDDQPFHAGLYSDGKYGGLFEKLDPDRVFLVLVDAEDGYLRNTDLLKRMVSKEQQFTQEVDFNKPYILGCVIFAENGDAFLVYDKEIFEGKYYLRSTILNSLTQEEVAALQVPGKFGVWTAQP